jgi:hypothetical protein
MFGLLAAQCLLLYAATWLLVADARYALYLSAVIACVYWAAMPSAEQGLFWLEGAAEDQMPVALGWLLFALVLFACQRPAISNASAHRSIVAASVVGFVTPAFHELAGGVFVLAVSLITGSAFLWKSPQRKTWLIVWAALTAGFLVAFVAPGNAVRMATELPALSHRGHYRTVIRDSLQTIRLYVLPWCLDFRHWLLAVLIWLDPRVASLRNRLPGLNSFGSIAGFLAVWISLILIAVAATIWNVGSMPPGRTLDLIYGIFLMGWTALAFLVVRPDTGFQLSPAFRSAALSGALILLSALVVTSNNTVGAVGDLVRGRVRSLDAQMDDRVRRLKAARANSDLVLPSLSVHPDILASKDISKDPNFWANRCLARYFGVASVRN